MHFHKFLLFLLFISISSEHSAQDTLVVGYTESTPFIIDDDSGLHGPSVWVWEQVAQNQALPFKYQKLGEDELIDGLTTGKVDIVINPILINQSLTQTVDFSFPFYTGNSGVVVHKANISEQLLSFFTSIVSITFLSSLVILSAIIGLFGFLIWRFEMGTNSGQFRKSWKGLWDGIWWSAVTTSTVGYGDKAPKSKLGKGIALILMLIAMVIVSSITASLSSNLTVDNISSNYDSYLDFKLKKVGTITNTSCELHLQAQLFKRIQSYQDIESAVNALCAGDIEAILHSEQLVRYWIYENDFIDETQFLKLAFQLQQFAFAMPLGNEKLLNNISKEIIRVTKTNEYIKELTTYHLADF